MRGHSMMNFSLALIVTLAASASSQDTSPRRSSAFEALVQQAGGSLGDGSPAAPATLPVIDGGPFTPGRCPENMAFLHEPSSVTQDPAQEYWHCYFDQNGTLHHWASLHHVMYQRNSYWWGKSQRREDRVVTGHPAILTKQAEYNKWLKANTAPRQETRTEGGYPHRRTTVDIYPYPVIEENGRLTWETILIPYYKSDKAYQSSHRAFKIRCSEVPGSSPCDDYRGDGRPDFRSPSEDIVKWHGALADFSRERARFKEYVDQHFLDHDPKGYSYVKDWVDCSSGNLDGKCAVEVDAAPAPVLQRFATLASSISEAILRAQKLQDDHEQHIADAEPVPAAPIEWIAVAGGAFAINDGKDEAKAPRQVDIQPFEMSKTNITVEQYMECVRAGQCSEPNTSHSPSLSKCAWQERGQEHAPMNCVNWDQANEFARFRGARLPTADEFEFVATNAGSTVYPWGDKYSCGIALRGPAGCTPQGICGLLTTGYGGQWAKDFARTYSGETDTRYRTLVGSSEERNCGYGHNLDQPRLVLRGRTDRRPNQHDISIGFRLVRSSR